MQNINLLALNVAQSQIGTQEIPRGSNAGPQVELYLKSVGLAKGYPWCMAFIYWCHQQVSQAQGLKNPLIKTGGVLRQYNEMPAKNKHSTPQVGDVFIMDFGAGIGHTGFVLEVLPNGEIKTIEGNTNQNGSREGYQVCIRTRKQKTIKAFLRL
jgi:hypothetical protein